MSSNCGGKKIILNLNKGEARVLFGCLSDARRAQQRIDREVLFGRVIRAILQFSDSNTDSSDTNEELNPIDEVMARYRPRNHSNPSQSAAHDMPLNELLPFCSLHSDRQSSAANKLLLPMVNISIPVLAKRVHRLVDTHGGALPLKSFLDCYVKEFFELFNTTDKPLVALEHLITCVPGVCILTSTTNMV